jgi:hypothetical protein
MDTHEELTKNSLTANSELNFPGWRLLGTDFSGRLRTELLYYDRRSVGQSVLVSSPHLGLTTRFLLLSDTCRFVDVGRPLWREDGSVFYNCCCLRQRSHSQARVPRGSWPPFTVSDLRLPQPGGPGPCIYIPREQGGPVIPPGTGFLPPYAWPTVSRTCSIRFSLWWKRFQQIRCIAIAFSYCCNGVLTFPLYRNESYSFVVRRAERCRGKRV